MSKTKTITIRPLDGFTGVSDAVVAARGTAVQTGLTGNPNFPSPPVDLKALKAAIDSFTALIAESLDGSKKVIAEKKKQRHEVTTMLRALARYVEIACKGDMAIFKSSGFEAASSTKAPPQPLPTPSIDKVKHGAISGQLNVHIKSARKAKSYELRYATEGANGAQGPWTTQSLTGLKPAMTVNGLTPGTVYVFEARALGKLGFTDWSNPARCMCT